MVEPIFALVSVDVGTHAAKKFIDTAIELGAAWVRARYIDQLPKAMEAAEENFVQYLNELAACIKKIENLLEESGQPIDKIEIALQNPDIALDYKETAIMAARTNNSSKHYLFAKLLAEKLIADEDNIYYLATSSAIQAIAQLNLTHMRILAMMVLIHHIRPVEIPSDEQNEFYTKWLSENISLINPGMEVSRLHFNHLMTTACLIPRTGLVSEVPTQALVRRYSGFEYETATGFLDQDSMGQVIQSLWDKGIASTTLTTTGRLIGRETFGVFFKDEVRFIDWD